VAGAFGVEGGAESRCQGLVELGIEGHAVVWSQVVLDRMCCHTAGWELGCIEATVVAGLEGFDTAEVGWNFASPPEVGDVGSDAADTGTLHEDVALPEQSSNGLGYSVVVAGGFVSRKTVAQRHGLALILSHSRLQAEVAAEHHIYLSV
jgi:hypothetical protein